MGPATRSSFTTSKLMQGMYVFLYFKCVCTVLGKTVTHASCIVYFRMPRTNLYVCAE